MPGGRVALGPASSDHGPVAETPGRDASPLSAAGRLALAVLLAIPFLASASTLILTTSFLVEFLGQGRWRPLSVLTRETLIRPLPVFLPVSAGARPVPVDLYTRTGLRPADADAVSAGVKALHSAGYRSVAVLGISLGAGPALLAASDPTVASGLSAVLALGGYASAVELLRYTLTGAYAFGGVTGRAATVLESAIAQFARANAELLDDAGRRLMDNRDPAAVDERVRALPQSTRDLLEALSPGRTIGSLRAPLFLI